MCFCSVTTSTKAIQANFLQIDWWCFSLSDLKQYYILISIRICAGLQVCQKCQLITSKKFLFTELHVCLSGKVGCCSHSVIKVIENSTK